MTYMARGELEIRDKKWLDVYVFAAKGAWNCGEEWVNMTFRVPLASFPENRWCLELRWFFHSYLGCKELSDLCS